MQAKKETVHQFLDSIGPKQRIVDIGANTGVFSSIAKEYADTVISLDLDQVAVDKQFRLRSSTSEKGVLPLCVDLAS